MNKSAMIFDSHCHYNLEPLYSQGGGWQFHWQKAQKAGVTGAVVVGTDTQTSQKAVEIAVQDPALFAAIGIHPHEYQDRVTAFFTGEILDTQKIQQEVSSLQQWHTSRVVAIGETGLDYFRLPEDPQEQEKIKQAQQAGLIAHMQLANELKLPLIIHVRDRGEAAYWTILELLKTHYQHHRPFILHCISGPTAYLQAVLEMGAFVGVAGNVTYKNAEHIRELVKLVPQNRLLLETDAPYLPPADHRGQTCEPWMISETNAFLRDQLSITPSHFSDLIR